LTAFLSSLFHEINKARLKKEARREERQLRSSSTASTLPLTQPGMSLDAYIAQQDRRFDTFRQHYAIHPHAHEAQSTPTRTACPLSSRDSDASIHSQLKHSGSAARITAAIQQGFPHERGHVFDASPVRNRDIANGHPAHDSPQRAQTITTTTSLDAKRQSHHSAYAAFREVLVSIDDELELSDTDTADRKRYSQQRSPAKSSMQSPVAGGIQIRKLGPAPWQMDDEDSDLEDMEREYRAAERAIAGLALSNDRRHGSMGSSGAEEVDTGEARSRTVSGDRDMAMSAAAAAAKSKPRKRSVFGFMKRVRGSRSSQGGSVHGSPASDLGTWSRKGSGGSTKTVAERSVHSSPVSTQDVFQEQASLPATPIVHDEPVSKVHSVTDKALPPQPLPRSASGQAVERMIQEIVFQEPLTQDRLALAPAIQDATPTRRLPPSASVPQLPDSFEMDSKRSSRSEVEVMLAADAAVEKERLAQHEAMMARRRQDRMSRMFDHIVMQ
jgi:hypothetical protein